ncbi:hypothetical protein MBT84_03490 [Streptomyces sp. MBT84]|nr:hypothetical protein [Streptomyces sp. MBT84]
MPNAGMTIAYMLISAMGATVFFAVSEHFQGGHCSDDGGRVRAR